MGTSLCLRALERTLATRGPVEGAIHHTDRGAQHASRADRQRVESAGMSASMSRKGDCWDNAVAQSFFGTLEQELVPETPWRDLSETREAVSHTIHHHDNPIRRHSTLGQIAPATFEARHHAAQAAAA